MSAEPATDAPLSPDVPSDPPLSINQRRWRKFKALKRGWYSFLVLTGAFLLTFLNPVLISDKALVVKYHGQLHFPAIGAYHEAKEFGQRTIGEARYRDLQREFAEKGEGNWVIMPPYPYHPNESLLKDDSLPGPPPHPPNAAHWMGTDDRGRDVFARLAYGFRISLVFGLSLVLIGMAIGVPVGASLGYFGGKVDLIGQRLIEIWSGIPFLYTVIIVASIAKPGLLGLIGILSVWAWMGITYYMRGEFYREKAKDYVAAAIAQGETHSAIIFRHILPNSLTPIVTFAPFMLVGEIVALVSLDFLGFGVPAPTPSWGELVNQGRQNIFEWHLVFFPLGALFTTLVLVVFIGEAVREAFDPKTFSRLR